MFKTLFIFLIKCFFKIAFRTKVEGIEKIDLSKPSLICPNHVSLLEAAMLALYLPKDIYYVVNTQIAQQYKWIMSFRKHITVDPLNPMSVKTMVRHVKSGKSLVIFPEGRITVTGGLMLVQPGAGYIAMKTGATIYPISVNGPERSKFSYLKGKLKQFWFPKIEMVVGNPYFIVYDRNVSMKLQKDKAAATILTHMQNELYQSRRKQHVNFYNELRHAAKLFGAKYDVLEDMSGKLNYKTLLIAINIFTSKLKRILDGEQNVALLLPNSNGHIIALFALFKLGKTPSILNFSAGESNLIDAADTSLFTTVLTSRVFIEKGKLGSIIAALSQKARIVYLEDIKETVTKFDKLKGYLRYAFGSDVEKKENEIILFTSGSESKPKGVVLTHDNLYANIQQARATIDFTQEDKILNALPMFHSFGLTAGTLLPLIFGMKLFSYPSPLHYKTIPVVSYNVRPTIIFGTSTFLLGYGKAAHPYHFFSIRYIFAGAEKLRDEVKEMWFEKFGKRIFEGYGITETAPILALNSPMFYKKGTVGRFVPGIEYKIEAVEGIEKGGNLLVKGPNVMKGYLIHGKGFVPKEEWYNTGDVVSIDAEGFVSIQSRLKMFAKIAGEMVSLTEVEQIAEKAFGSSDFAAMNLPDDRKGERIILLTTRKDVTKETLRAYINSNGYSSLKMPNDIRIVGSIPLLGSGKTDYPAVRKMLQET